MYKFEKLDEDTYLLKYKNKEFEIKKTVGLIQKLQGVNHSAKLALMKELATRGETANDYIVKRIEGNKTIEDKSNLVELEQYYVGVESMKIYDELCQEYFNMSFAELLIDIGIDYTDMKEVSKFTAEFSKTISKSESPSEEN